MCKLLKMLVSAWFFALLLVSAVAHARTEPETIEVAGTTFVVDAANGLEGFAGAAMEVIRQDWERVAAEAGAPSGETIFVHMERDFADYFERSGVPSRPPEWAVGLALPGRRVILMIPGNPTWQATMSHEMTHVAVAIAAGDGDVPIWFTEGFAVAVAEQWGFERMQAMVKASLAGALLDLRSLEDSFPPSRGPADVAYAQSFHFVRWVRAKHGDSTFRDIMALVRQGIPWSQAFSQRTGTLMTVSYDAWQDDVRLGYSWVPVLATSGIGGVLMTAVVLVAWRRKSHIRKQRLRQMGERESHVFGSDPDDRTFG
jgi:hypothetical protein